jgi:pimeloyl-ACP methyl ester carboxylesterase
VRDIAAESGVASPQQIERKRADEIRLSARSALLLLWVILTLAACQSWRDGSAPLFVAKDCAASLAKAGAACGTVSVPENYAATDGRRIDLNVIVFRAREPNSERNAQFDLEGGPGFAVTESADFYATDGESYRQHRDVVLADMRGTGSSNPLRCESIEAYSMSQDWAPLYPPDLVAECAKTLSATADLRQYTTEAAAKDIDAVRKALGYPRIDLNALSYGTTLALRYIDDFPQHVRSAVMVGTVPAELTPPRFHATAGAAGLQRIIDACAAESACAARFPHLQDELAQALQRMSPDVRPVFMEKIRTWLYLPMTARRVPLLIHKAANDDVESLRRARSGRPFADGLYLSITCSESMAVMDVDNAIAEADKTVFGSYRLQRQRDACKQWPVAAAEQPPSRARTSDVPVLFLSGAFDPVTPPAWTAEVARGFPRSTQVVVPQGGHVLEGMSGMDTCVDAMILTFVENPSAPGPDSSCVKEMSAGSFVLE